MYDQLAKISRNIAANVVILSTNHNEQSTVNKFKLVSIW